MSERQPRRDLPGTVRPSPDELQFIDPAELSRYDLLLAAIGIVIVGAMVIGHVASVPFWAALWTGGLAAIPMVVDGVALNPPT